MVRKFKDRDWDLANEKGGIASWDMVNIAVLMDIRDQLYDQNGRLARIESLMRCPNIQRGFISMNKLRLHVEKFGVRPKRKATP